MVDLPATGFMVWFMVMANSDVDGGAPSDLSARGRELPERSQRCGVGAGGTTDPRGIAGRPTTQDRHASGDKCHSLSAAHRLPLALSPARQLSATLDGLQHLLQVPA